MYNGIKDFLKKQESHMNYLSFGKYIYTLDHRTDLVADNYKLDSRAQDPPFVLSQYPFYMKYFCYGRGIGNPICPTWKGRSKVSSA